MAVITSNKKQTRTNTKEKILQEAIKLMAENGYSGASIRKIAKRVGVRESAIYNHFRNKEEIFLTILQEVFANLSNNFFEKYPPQKFAIRGKVYLYEYASTMKFAAFDTNNENLFRIILTELLHNNDVRELFLKNFYQDNIKHLASALFIMMQNNLIRSGDPILLAEEFFAPLFYFRIQILLLRIDNKPIANLHTIFDKHVDFFWECIATESSF